MIYFAIKIKCNFNLPINFSFLLRDFIYYYTGIAKMYLWLKLIFPQRFFATKKEKILIKRINMFPAF